MAVEPKVRNGVCVGVNPEGCARAVAARIAAASAWPALKTGPKSVLVLGASGGYGLAARIMAAFGAGAQTLGVSFEREPVADGHGSPGWYNNKAFDAAAKARGLTAATLVGDAFLPAMKTRVIATARADGFSPFDLVIYSLAAPVRTDPATGQVHRSAIKPIGGSFEGVTLDVAAGAMRRVAIGPASEDEIRDTVKVMGGEDWQLWVEALLAAGLLAPGVVTVAFSYVGPEATQAVYRTGTLGRAKAHLEATAGQLDNRLASLRGHAYVAVNKALVTRASAVIPAMPLYIAALYRVMKAKGLHEGCLEQMNRLFRDRLYAGCPVSVDAEGRIRMDDWEMREDVQAEVARSVAAVPSSVAELHNWVDIDGYRRDFYELHGF